MLRSFPLPPSFLPPLAHGAAGLWDEVLCFTLLLVVAIGVVVVYGRDLFKPGAGGGQPSSGGADSAPGRHDAG